MLLVASRVDSTLGELFFFFRSQIWQWIFTFCSAVSSLSAVSDLNRRGSFTDAFPPPSITSYIKTRSGSATFMSAIHLRYLKIHLRQWWWGGGWEWWGWWWQLSSAYVCCHVGMSWLGCWTSAHFSPTSSQRPLPIIHSDRYCPGVWSLDRKPVRGPTGLNERAKLMPVRTLENWSEAS